MNILRGNTNKLITRMAILYFLVLLVDLVFISTGLVHLRWVSKPLLVLILIIALVRMRKDLGRKYFFPWMAALVFSWLGDVLLLLEESFFIPGLLAFLCSHLSYMLLFYRIQPGTPVKKGSFSITLLLTVVYFVLFYQVILVKTASLFPAVLIYALIILGMWLMASYKSLRKHQPNVWLWMGALMFVVSDSLLGYNKFVEFIPIVGSLVMLTYGLAQYGLFRGILVSESDLQIPHKR